MQLHQQHKAAYSHLHTAAYTVIKKTKVKTNVHRCNRMYESSHYGKCGGKSQKEAVSCAPMIDPCHTLKSEVAITLHL